MILAQVWYSVDRKLGEPAFKRLYRSLRDM